MTHYERMEASIKNKNYTAFVMMIGLPGCGKSTLAKKYLDKGYLWLSSDNYRLNHPNAKNNEVFDWMQKKSIELLKNKQDVVYDATNLSPKFRRHILSMVRNIPNTFTIGILFVTPIEVCKERNKLRSGTARVPEEVYDRMLKSFLPPNFEEGFDYLTVEGKEERTETITEILDKCKTLSQRNHHHKFDLLIDHINAIIKGIEEDTTLTSNDKEVLLELAKYHDIGKLDTFSIDNKGEGHFYGHANVGAYKYLSLATTEVNNYSRGMATLIGIHMKPFEYEKNPTLIAKDEKLFGKKIVELAILFNKFDKQYA